MQKASLSSIFVYNFHQWLKAREDEPECRSSKPNMVIALKFFWIQYLDRWRCEKECHPWKQNDFRFPISDRSVIEAFGQNSFRQHESNLSYQIHPETVMWILYNHFRNSVFWIKLYHQVVWLLKLQFKRIWQRIRLAFKWIFFENIDVSKYWSKIMHSSTFSSIHIWCIGYFAIELDT